MTTGAPARFPQFAKAGTADADAAHTWVMGVVSPDADRCLWHVQLRSACFQPCLRQARLTSAALGPARASTASGCQLAWHETANLGRQLHPAPARALLQTVSPETFSAHPQHPVCVCHDRDTGDYHFWRLDADSTWSYKAGDTLSRNTYRNGTLLHDIELPDARGSYTQFCGYFEVSCRTSVTNRSRLLSNWQSWADTVVAFCMRGQQLRCKLCHTVSGCLPSCSGSGSNASTATVQSE